MSRLRSPASLLILAAALFAWGHAASFLGSGPVDDDFIVYRYARSLVQGDGLCFDPGERVEGFTTPLWMLVIAAGLAARVDPVALSLALSIAATGIAALVLGVAWRRRFPTSTWPVPALILAATPAFAWHGVAGLGTTVLAALLCGWLAAYERAEREDRPAWAAGVLLALACLTRQECALFALPFLVSEQRRGRAAPALLPIVALAGWTLFRLGYFGRLLPITYGVKKLPLAEDLGYGLRYLWSATLSCGIGVYLLLAALAWRGARDEGGSEEDARAPRAPGAARVALVGLWAHAAYVVYVGGDFLSFARFFQPTLPLAVYLACVGLRARTRGGRALPGVLVALAILAPQWTQLRWEGEGRAWVRALHDFNEKRWIALGRHFGRVLAPDTAVALSPIGAFGWYSRLPIVDVLGLTNESALGAEPELAITMKGHHRFDGEWVLAQRPELMILGNGVRDPASGRLAINPWERTIVQHPDFAREYVWMLMPIPDGAPLDLFKRRDVPPPPGAVPR